MTEVMMEAITQVRIDAVQRRHRLWPPEMMALIKQLMREGNSLGYIQGCCEASFPEHQTPSSQTLRRMVRKWKEARGEDWWSVAESSIEEAVFVLPALSLVYIDWPTKTEAKWIARIRRIAPMLKKIDIALDYADREREGLPSNDLDRLLAAEVELQ